MELIIHQLESCHLQEYVYRGEGNANIVIALPLTRSVLRFRKIMSTREAPTDEVEMRVLLEWKYFVKFILKFMGIFVTSPEVINCHPRDFKDWYEKVEVFRPEHRKHKKLYQEFAIKLPDYTQLPEHLDVDTRKPTFCIEIKPKQGFIPQSERQRKHCPYCVKQFHKIVKGIVQKRSKYCPCDLFSGDKKRIYRAIGALVESPQNNLIIFKDGNVVWGEGHPRDNLDKVLHEFFNNGSNKNNLEELYFLIEQALYRQFLLEDLRFNELEARDIISRSHVDHSRSDNIQEEEERTCDFPNGNLPESSIIGCLFRMQELHSSSADQVYNIYSQHSDHLNEEIIYFSDSSDYKTQENTIHFSDILILRNYLLFTTAKDCSVLLTFREVDSKKLMEVPRDHVITVKNNQKFIFNIGLTDLDPKPLNCIDKHRKRANKLLNCYK